MSNQPIETQNVRTADQMHLAIAHAVQNKDSQLLDQLWAQLDMWLISQDERLGWERLFDAVADMMDMMDS